MVVTIANRSVTFISKELESSLQLESCCITCKAADKPVRTCSNCKLVTYCCKDCQAADWERHKEEDKCLVIKKDRRLLKEASETIAANQGEIVDAALAQFGEFAFYGRPYATALLSGNIEELIDLFAAHFFDLPYTQIYMERMLSLTSKVCDVAETHNTRELWEKALGLWVEFKRLCHESLPDAANEQIVSTLLKLHRNDDAAAYILYWIEWRSRYPNLINDNNVLFSLKGHWPFPIRRDARLLDLSHEIRNADIIDMGVPVSFILTALAIKLRYICEYRIKLECANAFRLSTVGQTLPVDVTSSIILFVTGGTDATSAFAAQWEHANCLLNYIDEEYPFILPGVLDPSVLPPVEENTADDRSFNVREFLEEYEGSPPVLEMLTNVLRLRYGEHKMVKMEDE